MQTWFKKEAADWEQFKQSNVLLVRAEWAFACHLHKLKIGEMLLLLQHMPNKHKTISYKVTSKFLFL